jgi:WXG100 family type VII secretion target
MSQDLDGLRVEHAALDGAAADMHAIVGQMDERLDRLQADLAPLRAQWAGAQQEAYHHAKAQWDGAIHRIRDLLDESHRAVSASNADYAAADNRGAARFDF